MPFQCKTGAVIGKKDDTHWAQVIKASGVFGVVEIKDEEGKAQQKGMELVKRLCAEIEKGEGVQLIAQAVEAVWGDATRTLLFCIPVEKSVTILLKGEGVAYLKRDGHIAKLRGREGTISGVVRDGDMVFLASKTLKDHVSEEKLFTLFDHLHADEVGEKLAFALHENNDFLGYAGLFIEIKHRDTAEEEHVVSEERRPMSFARPKHAIVDIKNYIKHVQKRIHHGIAHGIKRLCEVDVRITACLLIVFLVSVGIGIRREWSAKDNKQSERTINEIARLYDEGVALIDLNAAKSRERLLAAQTLVKDAKQKIKTKSTEGRKLEELERELALVMPRATQEYEVTPELFYDVSLLRSGGKIDAFAFSFDTMAFLDKGTKTLFTLDITSKNGQIVGGGKEFEGADAIAMHGNFLYVHVPNGIHALLTKEKTVKQFIVKKPSDWGVISGFIAFGGNLYLLDTEKSRIWKYATVAKATTPGLEFSELREYLNPDTLPNFSQVKNFSIDGSVWMGTMDGAIVRFTQGKENAFIAKGVEPPFGKNLFVYTDDALDFVYVLDVENKRVVVLEKDGMYKSQYLWKSDMKPEAIAASEKEKKIFLFIDGKLYNVPLQ